MFALVSLLGSRTALSLIISKSRTNDSAVHSRYIEEASDASWRSMSIADVARMISMIYQPTLTKDRDIFRPHAWSPLKYRKCGGQCVLDPVHPVTPDHKHGQSVTTQTTCAYEAQATNKPPLPPSIFVTDDGWMQTPSSLTSLLNISLK